MDKNVISMGEARQRMASTLPLKTLSDLERLPARLTDAEMSALKEIANAPLPPPAACDDLHFAQCFRLISAVLPKQSKDELDGKLFVAAYRRILQEYSRDAISYLTEEAVRNCRWFPTIAECLQILERYRRDDDDTRFRCAVEERIRKERRDQWEEKRLAEPEPETDRRPLTQADVDRLPPYLVKLGLSIGAIKYDATGKLVPAPKED